MVLFLQMIKPTRAGPIVLISQTANDAKSAAYSLTPIAPSIKILTDSLIPTFPKNRDGNNIVIKYTCQIPRNNCQFSSTPKAKRKRAN